MSKAYKNRLVRKDKEEEICRDSAQCISLRLVCFGLSVPTERGFFANLNSIIHSMLSMSHDKCSFIVTILHFTLLVHVPTYKNVQNISYVF